MLNLEFSIFCAMALTSIGLIAGCIRMFIGPTAADRVVCLDFLTILLVAITSLLALQLDNAAYLDLGLALALVGFLATVAFARYLETNEVEPGADPAEQTDDIEPKRTSGESAP